MFKYFRSLITYFISIISQIRVYGYEVKLLLYFIFLWGWGGCLVSLKLLSQVALHSYGQYHNQQFHSNSQHYSLVHITFIFCFVKFINCICSLIVNTITIDMNVQFICLVLLQFVQKYFHILTYTHKCPFKITVPFIHFKLFYSDFLLRILLPCHTENLSLSVN